MEQAVIRAVPAAAGLSPASRKEEAMWLLERLAPDSRANNLALAFRVNGRLDPDRAGRAVAALVRRHEVLRTVYVAAGAELMKTRLAPEAVPVPLVESSDLGGSHDEIADELRPFVNGRFFLDGRPLLRAGLFHHADGDVVCLAFHHLVYDIISGARLLTEFVEAYEDLADGGTLRPALLEVVPAFTEPAPTPESLDFWQERLGDFDPSGLDLWCGATDVDEPTLRGERLTHVLSDGATLAVQTLQRAVRAPEAVVLLAAYDVLLAAHGAGPDLTVGSPVSVRPSDDPQAVGHHTNVLPLRAVVDPAESFVQLGRRVRDDYFAALSRADVPVDSISELVPRVTSAWRNRLFRHMFNYFPGLAMGEFRIAGTTAVPIAVENGYNKFDLEFFIATAAGTANGAGTATATGAGAGATTITVRYGTQKFTAADARALVERYDALLAALATDPGRPVGELRVWSAADHEIIDTANRTAPAGEPEPVDVVTAVREHAVRTPGAVAIQQGERAVTYGALWASALAARADLLEQGVGPGDFVAIAAARSPELTVAVLGVWMTGAAYLPVDPEHPGQRVRYLLDDSGARLVLTGLDLDLPGPGRVVRPMPQIVEPVAGEPVPEVPAPIDPESCAYLIYTSGSTGRPKGALLPHRVITNICGDYTIRLRLTPDDTTLWTTTFAFDMANLEHYVPLHSGGRIAVAPDEARLDGRVLREAIETYRPGVVQATPTTLRLVLDDVADRLAGVRVVTGGETVPVTLVRRLLATGCEVHHAYGPTETTTWCTWGVVPADFEDGLDIGGPIAHTQVMVCAPDGRELPVGVRGELLIAGRGVALGYHRRPELTAERFGRHPRHGRFYRSGDLGRWRPDGTLELFGRADRQVKLRGNRVELGEIEDTLRRHPSVRAVAVVVDGDRSGTEGRLVAFVEFAADGGPDELWEWARGELPRYELPQEFVTVGALPVNANEKVDYVALAELLRTRSAPAPAAGAGTGDRPDDPLVAELLGLWREVLGRDDLVAHANFFTQGGNSLLGARLVQLIEERTGRTVKLADLFSAPSPAGLAQQIQADTTETRTEHREEQ